MILISIIVPIFNVERYLTTCLDSLYNQGVEENNYEIILVNDGSTDHSLEICNHYAEIHSNIHIYSQENQGVSAARNCGLAKAVGEWVMFVDSDDYLCKDSLRYLLQNYCSEEFDAIRFWTRIRSDASINNNISVEGKVYFVGSGLEFIKKFGFETFCYTFLYKRSFLDKYGILFSPYKMGEDFLFTSEFLLSNPQICSTSSIVYQYLIHPNSASTSRNRAHARDCAYHHLEVNDKLLSIVNVNEFEKKDSVLYKKCIESLQRKMILIISRILSSNISYKEFKQIVERQKKIGILPIAKNNKPLFKSRISCFLINLLTDFPLLFLPTKAIYSHFFVPFVLPKLDRNR